MVWKLKGTTETPSVFDDASVSSWMSPDAMIPVGDGFQNPFLSIFLFLSYMAAHE